MGDAILHKLDLNCAAKSFIYNHVPTMDFCDFPELKRLHGAMR